LIVRHFLKWKDSADVARRAAAASALARAYLQSDLDIDDRIAAEAALTLLLDDPSPKVRFALAEALSGSARAPAQIVTALVHDQIDIAAIVIARSPVIHDGDLIERARTSPPALQRLIAGRPEVSNSLARALSRHGAADAVLELVGNVNARVCRDCLDMIVDRFAGRANLRGAVLERSDLPPELGRREAAAPTGEGTDWRELLSQWANNELVQGKQHILRAAVPAFERTLIEVALKHTQGRKRDAAELLGWGRNTLTRKMKELDM